MNQPNQSPSFISETAFAEAIGVSKGTVKKLRKSGLVHIRIGRRILFTDESFRDLIQRYAVKETDLA
jgi:hypothetical protein